jgi:hypothetical protein
MRSVLFSSVFLFGPLMAAMAQDKNAPAHTITFQVGANRPYYADYYQDERGGIQLGNIREYDLKPGPFAGVFLDQGQAERMSELLGGGYASSGAIVPPNQLEQTMRMLDPFASQQFDDRLLRAAAVNLLLNRDLNQWMANFTGYYPSPVVVYGEVGGVPPNRAAAGQIKEGEPKPANGVAVPVLGGPLTEDLKVQLKQIREESLPRRATPPPPKPGK